MHVPTLYKYDSKGKVRVWDVEVGCGDESSTVFQSYGLLGGKIVTNKYTAKGKNIGKANETTPQEQAILEAEALHRKKIKIDDYAVNVEDSGKQLRPMLAHDFLKVPHKLKLPCIAQPKLDGVRGLAYLNDEGQVEVQSRKGELYFVSAHLSDQLSKLLVFMETVSGMDVTIDGEYYIHGTSLQSIVGAAKKQKPLTNDLEFHIFDCIFSADGKADDCKFVDRYSSVAAAIMTVGKESLRSLVLVEVYKCDTIETVEAQLDLYGADGYEGIMLREDAAYELGKRSYTLIKYKKFMDAEFVIVGHEVDKIGGIKWIVEVTTKLGTVLCAVRPKGENSYREGLVAVAESYYGKLLKVKFQSYNKYGNLDFPVGIELDRTDA